MFVPFKAMRGHEAQQFATSVLFLISLLLATVTSAFAGQAVLAWDASKSPGVTGYMLHYGQASGSYTSKIDAGNNTTYTVPALTAGTKYYYAVTAYDAGRTESGFSNEASATVTSDAPVANFTANTTAGAAPLGVAFTSTSSGSITGYSWNFGDGATSTAQNPSHSYAAVGIYSVSLSVTGSGGSNMASKSGYISVSQPAPVSGPPVANFTVDKTSGPAPLTVKFSSTSTGTIASYSWTFGDGTGSTVQNSSHTYASAGTYTATLSVTGPAGSNGLTKTGYISVTAPAPAPAPVPVPAPVPAPGPAVGNGLVAAYSFNEGTGSTVIDLSGNGNNGVITNARWSRRGRFGKALSFNGVDSWVTVDDAPSLDLTTGMTLEAWVFPTATLTPWAAIVMKEQAGEQAYTLTASSDQGQPATIVYGSSAKSYLYAGTSIAINAWTHLAATYDGTTQKMYINGVQVASQAQTGAMVTSSNPLRIGGDGIWGEYFQGRIDEIRIYNRALSPAAIQADMNTPVVAAK